MKQSITREENQGLRWSNKFHPMGKMSNFMNDMVYQPQSVPGADLLDMPLSPLHRAELLEAMVARCIPEPHRRLTWRDYFAVLRRPATDPYENSKYKAAWEAKYPALADQLKTDWEVFLAALPPPDLRDTMPFVSRLDRPARIGGD